MNFNTWFICGMSHGIHPTYLKERFNKIGDVALSNFGNIDR
jgi:hypothetical protein